MRYKAEDFEREADRCARLGEAGLASTWRLRAAALRIAARVCQSGYMERHSRGYNGVALEPEDQAEIDAIREALTHPKEGT